MLKEMAVAVISAMDRWRPASKVLPLPSLASLMELCAFHALIILTVSINHKRNKIRDETRPQRRKTS